MKGAIQIKFIITTCSLQSFRNGKIWEYNWYFGYFLVEGRQPTECVWESVNFWRARDQNLLSDWPLQILPRDAENCKPTFIGSESVLCSCSRSDVIGQFWRGGGKGLWAGNECVLARLDAASPGAATLAAALIMR